jgi:hypothetical protein
VLFHAFQDGIDDAESAGDLVGRDRLPSDDAMARE